MRILNLGILAHVDAGKTSLTERLLYEAGVIDHVGRVDDGSTQTDTLDLERRRGITIKSAVVSFRLDAPDDPDGVIVNLIDTPGHPDFIAEVERVLDVLDAVVLVISAVEGVQPQTRILTRAVRRLGVPLMIFVNKIDRRGARSSELITEIAERLELRPLPLGSVNALGRPDATFRSDDPGDAETSDRWAEVLAASDDHLLSHWVDHDLGRSRLRAALARQTAATTVQPLIFGSAMTGAGVADLRRALVQLLPARPGDPDAAAAARIFAVQRDADRRRIVLARVSAGTLQVRDQVWVGGRTEAKITSIAVMDAGTSSADDQVGPGRIARLAGLADARIGDLITDRPATPSTASGHAFAPPALETIVEPVDAGQAAAVFTALTELADQDPLINFRRGSDETLSLSLYGEVQKEVIGATLDLDYGLRVRFLATSPICVERVVGTGTAVARLKVDPNPFLAGIGLRIEPGEPGSGVRYAVDGFMLGTLPPAFFAAIEETVIETLGQGLHGWQVIDCAVTLIHTGYAPRQSHAHAHFDKSMSSTGSDFRFLTPLVLMEGLVDAGTEVLGPVHRFVVDLPGAGLSPVLSLITGLGGVPDAPAPHGPDWRVSGEIPAREVYTVGQRLPGLTSGEGAWESEFSGYRPVRGAIPERRRTDNDPLHRKEYLLRVQRRQLN